jgi:flagellar motor protein MotB
VPSYLRNSRWTGSPRLAWAVGLSAFAAVVVFGCADNPMVLKGRVAQFEQQQAALTRQNQQYQERIAALDRDNQELQTTLAQSRQQGKLMEDQLAGVREQLRGTTGQLSQVQNEKQDVDRKAQALNASMRRQTGVSITPNNSFLQTLPVIHSPDVHVRRDGDVIRVELPGSQLFEQGSARLRPGAANVIADAATEIRRSYPEQILGIEGHTDSDPVSGGLFRTNHELSTARAMAVYDVLVSSGRYRPDQLFLVGHGPNHPVVSNATAEGKQRNRRVELVVYPERRGQ